MLHAGAICWSGTQPICLLTQTLADASTTLLVSLGLRLISPHITCRVPLDPSDCSPVGLGVTPNRPFVVPFPWRRIGTALWGIAK